MDELFKELVVGICKPLYDLIISIIIYALIQPLIAVWALIPTQTTLSLVNNPTIFLPLFSVVAITEELFWGIKMAYYDYYNAVVRILGIIIGTFVFWGFLILSYSNIGGNKFDIFLSLIIAISAMCIGVLLRVKISNR